MSAPYLYEILIRGSATGILGAHAIYAADSVNGLTGEARVDIGTAQPIELGSGLAAVLGEAADQALGENFALKVRVGQLEQELEGVQQEVARLQAELAQIDPGESSSE